MKRSMPLVILLALAVIVSACNSPLLPSFLRSGGTPTVKATAPRALPTAKAAAGKGATTVSPVATPAAGAPAEATIAPVSDLTPAVTAGAGPTAVVAPAATAEGAAAADCTDAARMVKDVTIPDNTAVARGQLFVKTWRLQNSGSCPWTTNYAIVFASGEKLGAADATNLPGDVPPGGSIDVSVDLTAPDKAGTFRGNWKMRNADGETFNITPSPDGTFWVQIVVK